jgi:hypothetical protein
MRKFLYVIYFRIIETVSSAKGTDGGVANVLRKNGSTPKNPANDKGTCCFDGWPHLFTYLCLCSVPTVSAHPRGVQQT